MTTPTLAKLLNRTQTTLMERGLAEGWAMSVKVDPTRTARGGQSRNVTLSGEIHKIPDPLAKGLTRSVEFRIEWAGTSATTLMVKMDRDREHWSWNSRNPAPMKAPVRYVTDLMDKVAAAKAAS